MELMSRKRKGSPVEHETVELEDYEVQKKKKLRIQKVEIHCCGCGSLSMDIQGKRGLKRKIGCVDASTCMRRKKVQKDYVLGSEIGWGQYGSVRLCKNRKNVNGGEFACKSLAKGRDMVHREVEIMQHLSGHPGIVALKAAYEDSTHFHLVMELCCGGTLKKQMAKKEGCHSEHQAACILKELILIIKYCHDMGVVHRDIKPANILLTKSGRMKLADFGLATRISNGRSLSGLAGTASHIAPEILTGEYSEKVDIWSAGVILYSLLVGTLPFQGNSVAAIFEAIKTSELDFNSGRWESISNPARNLIRRMLLRDVPARITADEVLKHPWILFHTEELNTTTPIISSEVVGSIVAKPSIQATNESRAEPKKKSVQEEVQNDYLLFDELAVAISCMRISKQKQSKLCYTASLIRPYSKMSKLCTAF